MTARRIRVGLVFGGRSSEHEVSLMSAESVLGALDPERYEVVPIGITKEGRWLVAADAVDRLITRAGEAGALEGEIENTAPVALVPEPARGGALLPAAGTALPSELTADRALDVVFPLVHGRTGEDGVLQGLLDLAGVPYVGAGVLASALAMDKGAAKAMWTQAGLPVGEYRVVRTEAFNDDPAAVKADIVAAIGFPCFVKPANSGSSIGVNKVERMEQLDAAIRDAAQYDLQVIVERAISGRELECGVIGNEEPEASVVGEIIPGHEFYDYEDKYFDDAVQLIVPADLPDETAESVRSLAIEAYRTLGVEGMARVDFFLEGETDVVLLNELNTIPGFTRMSMFPRLWAATGVAYPELCDRLIGFAIDREARRRELRATR